MKNIREKRNNTISKNFLKLFRQTTKYFLTGSKDITLQKSFPKLYEIQLKNIGLYLHIPFCKKPCLYCPYFKEKYSKKAALDYKNAVIKEISYYKPLLKDKKITSFYIGGGTPTTMIDTGLEDIIKTIKESYNLNCDISSESHPNDINEKVIHHLKKLGVRNISMGIETYNDYFLDIIKRPYDSKKAQEATKLLVDGGFDCTNIDIMFGLPNQKTRDVKEDIKKAIELGVDQISTYPIFTFPHTKLKQRVKENKMHMPNLLERRKMLKQIEKLCYKSGMHRTGVWSFTKKGVKKYSSVTIPHYIGLGAGAGSIIPGYFYINIFSVQEYISHLSNKNKPPVVLTIDFSKKDEMMHWIYWRIYETKIIKKDFNELFNTDFDKNYKKMITLFRVLGLAYDLGDEIVMTDFGNYWVHVIQNLFSLDFIGKVWSVCLKEKWPKQIELI